jgi:hypothetical protein
MGRDGGASGFEIIFEFVFLLHLWVHQASNSLFVVGLVHRCRIRHFLHFKMSLLSSSSCFARFGAADVEVVVFSFFLYFRVV